MIRSLLRKIFYFVQDQVLVIIRFCILLTSPSNWSVKFISKSLELSKEVKTPKGSLFFQTISPITLYRVNSFYDKEPETIEWIQSMTKDDVLYDVGANVGIYSLYAGLYCQHVYSFEPVASNYFLLNNNIAMNKVQNKISAYCLAISDEEKVGEMHLSEIELGSAHSTFDMSVDQCHKEFRPQFLQGSFATTLDDLVCKYDLAFPSYLKVDVDGLENKIIKGANKMLKDKRLKGILIELNKGLQVDMAMIDLIKSNGFRISGEGEAINCNGMHMCNLIFSR